MPRRKRSKRKAAVAEAAKRAGTLKARPQREVNTHALEEFRENQDVRVTNIEVFDANFEGQRARIEPSGDWFCNGGLCYSIHEPDVALIIIDISNHYTRVLKHGNVVSINPLHLRPWGDDGD